MCQFPRFSCTVIEFTALLAILIPITALSTSERETLSGSQPRLPHYAVARIGTVTPPAKHHTQRGGIASVSFSMTSNLLVAGAHSGLIIVWDVNQKQEIARLPFDRDPFSGCVVSFQCGSNCFCATRINKFMCWKISNNRDVQSRRFSSNGEAIDLGLNCTSMGLSSNNRYAAFGLAPQKYDPPASGLLVLDLESGQPVILPPALSQRLMGKRVDSVAFAPSRAQVAFCPGLREMQNNQPIEFVELEPGIHQEPLYFVSGGSVASLAFNNDGALLACGGGRLWTQLNKRDELLMNENIVVWELQSKKENFRLTHPGIVRAVAFSPDGKMLASGGSDENVRLWDAKTAKQLAELHGHQGTVEALAFSADGQWLASGSADTTVLVWDMLALRKNLVQ